MFGHAATYDAAAQPYFTSDAAMPIASPTAARSSGQADGTFPSRSSLTQPPNEFAERIYSRMPVILDVEEARAWLEPGRREPSALLEILAPTPAAPGRRTTSVVRSAMFVMTIRS